MCVLFDLNAIPGKLPVEAIQVVFEELRKKGKSYSIFVFLQCCDKNANFIECSNKFQQ